MTPGIQGRRRVKKTAGPFPVEFVLLSEALRHHSFLSRRAPEHDHQLGQHPCRPDEPVGREQEAGEEDPREKRQEKPECELILHGYSS